MQGTATSYLEVNVISLSWRLDDVNEVTVFWNVMPCGLVEIYRDFGGHVLPKSSITMASSSEPLANFY
jgi:hypothetical protein